MGLASSSETKVSTYSLASRGEMILVDIIFLIMAVARFLDSTR